MDAGRQAGGLAAEHILAVYRCLHRALAQAVTWRLVGHNVATHATPPPVPTTEAAHKEPASIIAAQLRHADGGTLAQRVYIHQLPRSRPGWLG